MGHGYRKMGNMNKILGHSKKNLMEFLTFKWSWFTELWKPQNKGNMFIANILVSMTQNFGVLPKILGTTEIWVTFVCVRDP